MNLRYKWIALLACVLFHAPTLGWTQMIVAHRGASHDAPENTLAAFNLAWEQESDAIEGDFYLTADQQIVCLHDRDTHRTTGVKRLAEKSTLRELKLLDYGSWKGDQWKGEPIPTFADVFESIPDGKLFVIELKSKQAIVPILEKQLKSLPVDRIRLMIISFDRQTIAACKRRMPDIKAHWLTGFDKTASGQYKPSAAKIAEVVQQSGADGVGMKGVRAAVDETFINQLKEGDCHEFHFWTIDKPEDARYFSSLGAIAITTNVPAIIGESLRPVAAAN